MQRNLFFSFLLSIFCYQLSFAQGGTNSCTLPAPVTVNYAFASATSITVNWSKVAGAWGYKATLTNNGTGVSETKTIQEPVNSVVFDVVPGEYSLALCPKCTENEVSEKCFTDSKISVPDFIIVADLVVERAVPSTGQLIWELPVLNGTATSPVGLSLNTDYCFSFNYGSNDHVEVALERFINPFFAGYVTVAKDIEDPDWTFTGVGSILNPATGGYVFQKIRASKPNKGTLEMSFVASINLRLAVVMNPGGMNFNNIKLYVCEQEGEPRSIPQESNEYAGLTEGNIPSAIPNPFKNWLSVNFSNPPKTRTSIRLIDFSGRIVQEFLLHPDELSEGSYTFNTEDLMPGLYFLQLQSDSGERRTVKVVRTE